jgi:hypothetical protein
LGIGGGNFVELRSILASGELGAEKHTLTMDPSMEGFMGPSLHADFNPSGELVVIVLDDTLQLWEVPEADTENEHE